MSILCRFVLVLLLGSVVAATSYVPEIGDQVLARKTDHTYHRGIVRRFLSCAQHHAAPCQSSTILETSGSVKVRFPDGDEIIYKARDKTAIVPDISHNELQAGAHVLAPRPKSGNQYFIGFAVTRLDEGRLRVQFDDNNVDEYYTAELRLLPDYQDVQTVGARVFARRPANGLYYRGFVDQVTSSTLIINFDDGSTTDYNKSDRQAVILDVLPDYHSLREDYADKAVIAFWPRTSMYYPGRIISIKSTDIDSGRPRDTLWRVQFDNGRRREERYFFMRIIPS